ncbi:leishmanolysin-like peptidase [Planoprotostelium fungivorum]|uniref:Leishmanolysin-like peptidase n=1 Tax=Planoprotostelium fungivorum TaxID=1890364 RepID=A0A2P6N452_9EUKA|nr:leishmanolysin-like peptidase [Planoprotostelium fungivorum]
MNRRGFLLLVLCSFFYVSIAVESPLCDFVEDEGYANPDNYIMQEQSIPPTDSRKRATTTSITSTPSWPVGWNNMRIKFDFTYVDPSTKVDTRTCWSTSDSVGGAPCTSDQVVSSDKYNSLKNSIIPNAQSVLQQVYAVRPMAVLNVGSSQCNSVNLNPGTIPDTDLLVYVFARPVSNDQIIAQAAACQFDGTTRRSTVGYINFNPVQVASTTSKYSYAQVVSTAVHESSHILGFSFNRLNAWYDASNPSNNVVPYDQVVKTFQFPTSQAGVTRPIYKIVSPLVLRVAKDHYNCSTIDGVELENFPAIGTNGSHWEMRTVMSEYMVGVIQDHPVISRFTMAFFQDSGWYMSNFSLAGALQWGAGLGCSFVQQYCTQSWPSTLYLCGAKSAAGCNYDRTSTSGCYIAPVNPKPDGYNYPAFADGMYGDPYADYCPYYVPVDKGDCTVLQNGITTGAVTGTRGVKYGFYSRCYMNSLLQNSLSSADTQPGCYQSVCIYGKLKVLVGSVYYDCPIGGKISPDGYGGSINCPTDDTLCDTGSSLDPNYPQLLSQSPVQQQALAGSWPSISPTSGGPGTIVNIYGGNFTSNMTGTIKAPANCEYLNTTNYVCTIASLDFFNSLTSIPKQTIDVSLVDTNTGKSCSLNKGFEFSSSLNALDIAITWIKRNPYAAAGTRLYRGAIRI